jgi:hypothetical protein
MGFLRNWQNPNDSVEQKSLGRESEALLRLIRQVSVSQLTVWKSASDGRRPESRP